MKAVRYGRAAFASPGVLFRQAHDTLTSLQESYHSRSKLSNPVKPGATPIVGGPPSPPRAPPHAPLRVWHLRTAAMCPLLGGRRLCLVAERFSSPHVSTAPLNSSPSPAYVNVVRLLQCVDVRARERPPASIASGAQLGLSRHVCAAFSVPRGGGARTSARMNAGSTVYLGIVPLRIRTGAPWARRGPRCS